MRRVKSLAIGVGVGLVIISAGTAIGLLAKGGGTIDACVKKDGGLRIREAGEFCKKGESELSWSQNGQAFSRESQTNTNAGIAISAFSVVHDIEAVCPDTWLITGGGCSVEAPYKDQIAVHASYPKSTTTWSCSYRNLTNAEQTVDLTVAAVCGK